MSLEFIWFLLLGVLLAGYAVLDGFDLGVGILSGIARTDKERRILLNAIGPFWDGNEVWLITFGGALFAAFPRAYAAAFSAFYLPAIALLFFLIMRAVSFEFRSKKESGLWRSFWDNAFRLGSAGSTFAFGFLVGNLIQGIKIGPGGNFQGNMLEFLSPYSILTGFLSLSIFALHGTLYLSLKTEGELWERVKKACLSIFGVFTSLFFVTTVATFVVAPGISSKLKDSILGWLLVLISVLCIGNVGRCILGSKFKAAFLSSCASIVSICALIGFSLYPNLVPSSLGAEYSLTVQNSASSPRGLLIMLIIAGIGMPVVLIYTFFVYRTFRGKVQLDEHSY